MRSRAVVAGGAGFIGYTFVSRLLQEDFDVIVVDNLATGTRRNVNELLCEDRCELHECDICALGELSGPIDYVVNLACPASPVDFSRIPVEIMRACSEGTYHLLELALHKGAEFLQAIGHVASGVAEPLARDEQIAVGGDASRVFGQKSSPHGFGQGRALDDGPAELSLGADLVHVLTART